MKKILVVAIVSVLVLVSACTTEAYDWQRVNRDASVTIDNVVISYSVTDGAPGVPQTWDEDETTLFHNFGVNEVEGTENIGSYLFSMPNVYNEGEIALEHDPHGRTVLVKVIDDHAEVALVQK